MVPVAWSEVTGRKRPAARSLPLWPPPRPGRSRFRRFRSYLAPPPALQLRPWPAFRPGVRLFRRFRSHLADGASAAASPWNIAVRTAMIPCAPGPLVRTALNLLLSRAHQRPFHARDRLRAHGTGMERERDRNETEMWERDGNKNGMREERERNGTGTGWTGRWA